MSYKTLCVLMPCVKYLEKKTREMTWVPSRSWQWYSNAKDNAHGSGPTEPHKCFSHLLPCAPRPSVYLCSSVWHHLLLGSKALKLHPQWLTPSAPKPVPLALSARLLTVQHSWALGSAWEPSQVSATPALLLTFSCVPSLPVGPYLSEPSSFLLLPLFEFL